MKEDRDPPCDCAGRLAASWGEGFVCGILATLVVLVAILFMRGRLP